MQTFIIDRDNNITAIGAGEAVPEAEGVEGFKTRDEFGQLAAGWPTSRLVDIWNGIPGSTRVKRFTDRETAVTRIWKAVQSLGTGAQAAQVATGPTVSENKPIESNKGTQAKKPARKDNVRKAKAAGREGTKTAQVLTLLQQPDGATLTELMKATRWQAHSVRGFLSGAVAKKMGLAVKSTKRGDGERVYKIGR
jgi:hypothetical protein